ncbi:ankyrin repeat domain-containing protein [Burkholderia cepacia]
MSDKKEIPTKHKIVGGVIVGAVVLAVASNFIHPFSAKEVAIDTAKGAGKLALEKGKEKLADMKAQHDAKVAANQASQVNATAQASDTSSGNNLKNVESEQFISIDNVPVKSDNADTMLMNAISAGDLDRVQYLVQSGINPTFTDNEVCFANIDGTLDSASVKFPKDVVDMKTFIAVSSAKKQFALTTKCSKLFLLNAASKLNNNFNQDEFPYYNRAWTEKTDKSSIQRDKDKIADETKREQIYSFILSKTQDKDLYQLPIVFLNTKVPYSIRKEALDKYLALGDNYPKTQSRAAFLKMYDDATNELINSDPNNKQLMAAVSLFKNPWNVIFAQETKNFFTAASKLDGQVHSLQSSLEVEKKYHSDAANLEVPVLTVDSMTNGGVKYTESTNSVLWYFGIGKGERLVDKYDFQNVYELNKEIKLITSIVESKKVNLNYQDLQGNSILHFISSQNGYLFSSAFRPMAIETRYLLNNGVNANLMNKEGKTAFMITQDISSKSGSADAWGEISKAYSDKNYN